MFETLKNEEYGEKYYTEGLRVLGPYKDSIEKMLLKLSELRKNWDIQMVPEYQIVLTKYGPGGSYDENTGTIVVLTTKDEEFKFGDPLENIMHKIGLNGHFCWYSDLHCYIQTLKTNTKKHSFLSYFLINPGAYLIWFLDG